MRVAVLNSSPRVGWTNRRLLQALANRGFEAHYVLWDAFSASNRGACRVQYRGRCNYFDAVIVRGIGRSISPEILEYRYTLLELLEKDNIYVINPAHSIRVARNKLSATMKLDECGLPTPETLVTENPAAALRAVKVFNRAVIKPLMGSLGLGSFLADGVDTAYYVVNLLAELNQPLYIQKYIDKRNNRDIRVFVVDGEVAAAIYRYAEGWKSNIAQGAKPAPADLDNHIAGLAVRAAACIGLLYAGIDIVESTENGRVYILEANASPLWRGLYRATGVDPATHIAELVWRLLKA